MLVVMATTMMIAVPLTLVIGSILAVRERPAAVGHPALRHPGRRVVARVDRVPDGADVPADAGPHRPGQRRLREQITGIRVVRAFVREPEETERFAAANADVTETRCGPAG